MWKKCVQEKQRFIPNQPLCNLASLAFNRRLEPRFCKWPTSMYWWWGPRCLPSRFLSHKYNHPAARCCLCLMNQALPLVTVVVGRQTPGQEVTLVTASEDADEPRRIHFSLPSDGSAISPGSPSWANYVKGVIQHYRGKQMNISCTLLWNHLMIRIITCFFSLHVVKVLLKCIFSFRGTFQLLLSQVSGWW